MLHVVFYYLNHDQYTHVFRYNHCHLIIFGYLKTWVKPKGLIMADSKNIPTEQAAQKLGVKANTLRTHLCLRGHYFNIVPKKLPNRRLLWPADKIDALLSGEVAQ